MRLSTFSTFKKVSNNANMITIEGSLLLDLQHVLCKMLNDFHSCCKRNNINYFVCGGTLLGAVRHKGFIPWDDDIDVCMPREDYLKFKTIFDNELGNNYYIHDAYNKKNYGLASSRIRKKGTKLITRDDYENDDCGVFIDIFIVENVYDNQLLRSAHGLMSLFFGFALSCRRFYQYSDSYLELVKDDSEATKIFKTKIFLGKIFSFKSMDGWCVLWDKWNQKCCNSKSKRVNIPVGRKHYFGEMWKREDIFPTQIVPFEDIEVNIPAHPSIYLTSLYGEDYMVIPPVAERETHVVYAIDLGEAK